MWKSFFAIIITFIIGVLFMAIGNDIFNGFPEFGSVASVSVMGGFIIYFIQQNKK